MTRTLVLSCEHGGKRVPARHRARFRGAASVLRSHRGWDAGALELARRLARGSGAPLVACTVTRLVADPNRSRGNPGLFSEWTRDLGDDAREAILAGHWSAHRDAVAARVSAGLGSGGLVLHLSVHSFTPVWKGRARAVDVGLLFDPARPRERAFVDEALTALGARRPDLRVRRNAPYRGWTDGLTTALRARFGPRYLGIELEVSQRFPLGGRAGWTRLQRDLEEALVPLAAPVPARGVRRKP